jgi:hypothetical protein
MEQAPAAGNDMDMARVDDLDAVLARVVPALKSFLDYQGPDPAARRSTWRAALDTPLPERGAGAESVLATLAEQVVAHGLRTGAPGFCGWVTTHRPLAVGCAVAVLAALVAFIGM